MPLYIVTIKLPKDPSRPHALSCRHEKMLNGHCGFMRCPNYRSTCNKHAIAGDLNARCSREKKTDKCPIGINEVCTDSTGEHHTLLVEAENTDLVTKAVKERGYSHITRIERGWILKVG